PSPSPPSPPNQFGFVAFASGMAGYFGFRNLRHQDVCWVKSNRFPYETVGPNQTTKAWNVNGSFESKWSR
ncbi:hypothetical protein BDK51DRAFT_22816, partial [Blyttiomyces helicus]